MMMGEEERVFLPQNIYLHHQSLQVLMAWKINTSLLKRKEPYRRLLCQKRK